MNAKSLQAPPAARKSAVLRTRRPPAQAASAAPPRPGATRAWLAAAGVLAALVWSYWPTIAELVEVWQVNEDYSVGQLVPLVAAGLVWRERRALAALHIRPAWVGGLAALLLAEALRGAGVYYGVASAERYALLGAAGGAVLLSCGWAVAWRVRWVLAFLLLMIPLPARIHEAISLPLQSCATAMTVFGLELLGIFVVREGNVLRLEDSTRVAVTEACSGLRMLAAFVFVAAVLALLSQRPRWQRALLLAASVPVAVLCNALRGIATALFAYGVDSESARQAFHDAAGLAMMPVALLLSFGLLRFFDLLRGPGAAATPRSAA